MNAKIKQAVFYITAFVVIIALSVAIFRPYLIALAVSGMLAVILSPLYVRMNARLKSPDSSALLTIVLLLIVIIVPLLFISSQIIVETQDLYSRLASGDSSYIGAVSLNKLSTYVNSAVRPYDPAFSFQPIQYVESFSAWIVSHLQGFFSGTLDLAVKFILGLVALFYFLRDGEEFKKSILAFSPLSSTKDKIIIDSLESAIRSVLLGSIFVAIIYGFVNALGLAMTGVPNFTLWATAAAIGSFIPFIGPALVWVPATIYLYFYGWSGAWLILLIWSILFTVVMNNFLVPLIFNRGIRIHPLFVLFAILGGLQLFGPMGFLIGPLIISLLFVLIKVVELSENPAAADSLISSEHAEK